MTQIKFQDNRTVFANFVNLTERQKTHLQLFWSFINCFRNFKQKYQSFLWFQLLKYDDLLLFFAIYYSQENNHWCVSSGTLELQLVIIFFID